MQHTNYLLEGLETERLRFRKLTWDDFDEWSKLFVSEDTIRFLGLNPALSQRELTTVWFEKTFERYENGRGSMNALIDKQSGRLVGQSGLLVQEVEGEKRLEVSYSILPEFWRQGYAYEAANACKNYAFEHDWADNLISIIDPDNLGSQKVAIKNGMTIERFVPDYKGAPVNIFSIHKRDWLAGRNLPEHAVNTHYVWNKLAAAYEERFMDLDHYNESYDLFCAELKTPNASVLEVGCGPGNLTKQLLSRRPDLKLHGTDVAPDMIELAKKNNPTATFSVLDARNISQLESTFDAIVCGFCIPYLNWKDVDQFFSDSAKLLAQDGLLYVSCIEEQYEKSHLQTGSTGDQLFVHYYLEADLRDCMERNSFQHLQTIRIPYSVSDGSEQIHLVMMARRRPK